MSDIKQAAMWTAQGNPVRRRTWPVRGHEDYQPSIRMYKDRRLMTANRALTNWNLTNITIEDVLADDWEIEI